MSNLKLFDHYSLRARLQPALLTLLPLAFGIFAWVGPNKPWLTSLWTLFGTAGGTYFLAIVARNQGKKLEPQLWQSWGGAPTTQLLRHYGTANPVLRTRWHSCLSKLLGEAFPTKEDERLDPTRADKVYEASVRLLINKTRDIKRFPLIYKENVLYGFCRNLYGLRKMGISAALIGFISGGIAVGWFQNVGNPQVVPWVCATANTMFLFWWIFKIKPDWVKVPAFAYAERLLESCEDLSKSRKRGGATPDSNNEIDKEKLKLRTSA